MRSLNVILMLLGALSVLMLGALPASAMPGGSATPPCHQAGATSLAHHEAPTPEGAPDKPMAAMACCISCVVAPLSQPPAREPADPSAEPDAPVPARLPVGLSPAPEHGPPKA